MADLLENDRLQASAAQPTFATNKGEHVVIGGGTPALTVHDPEHLPCDIHHEASALKPRGPGQLTL